MQPAISAVSIGKRYRIGVRPSATLRDAISRTGDAIRARLRGGQAAPRSSVVWALKDVTFEVDAGEIVGVVGRNGAGKSTLLKLLSRITAPTEGRAVVRGRVGSLLEVGTGFHGDLSGRDNTYLSGAILGMKSAEINRLFDSIVAFAEIDRFIDTPVKHYSSGMYMRLAFAVAAHLETEIMLVDEVLAVGDMAFQKKCLGKMGDVAASGRTVLLVSHNMQAIRSLCPRTLVLHSGTVVADDRTNAALRRYDAILGSTPVDASMGVRDWRRRRGSGAARFTKIEVQNSRGEECHEFETGEPVRFVLTLDVYQRLPSLGVNVSLRSGLSREIVTTSRHILSSVPVEPGENCRVVVEFPAIELRPGEYALYFGVSDYHLNAIDVVDDLTRPLIVSTSKTWEDLGFDPASPAGYFSIASRLVSNEFSSARRE